MEMVKMTPERFLDAALEHVESKSIREWARSDHNRPIMLKMADGVLKKNPAADPLRFGTYVTCLAIGL